MTGYTLRNDIGKIVTIADRDTCFRFLKHNCPDGDYSLEGKDTNLILERRRGVVYPTGGTLDANKLSVRTLTEAQNIFDGGQRNG